LHARLSFGDGGTQVADKEGRKRKRDNNDDEEMGSGVGRVIKEKERILREETQEEGGEKAERINRTRGENKRRNKG
jgi:hypothetical protein